VTTKLTLTIDDSVISIAKKYAKENNIDLMILGIRKSESGIRSEMYKNCFVPKNNFSYIIFDRQHDSIN
jgi:hypothetical protein